MDDEARRARIRQFVEAINTGQMEVFDAKRRVELTTGCPRSAATRMPGSRPAPPGA
jgi:hypothetical protein